MVSMDMVTAMGIFNNIKKRHSLSDGVLKGATDLHSHILYGVDDGIATLDESLAVLALEESMGIKNIWCTPHVMDDIPNTTESLRVQFQKLQQAYSGPINLHLAAEYMLDSEFEQRLLYDDLLTIGDMYVLVETSMMQPPYNLEDSLKKIMSRGYRPLLAHPERYRYLNMNDYRHLDSIGVHFQLNLPSLVGYYGETVQIKANQLLRRGMYKKIGSDCHRLKSLQEQLSMRVLPSDIYELLNQIF